MKKIKRFTFDIAYCNIFILTPLYLSLKWLGDIIPSSIVAALPYSIMLIIIIKKIFETNFIKKNSIKAIIIVIFLILGSFYNSYLQVLLTGPFFWILIIFIIFLLEEGADEELYKDMQINCIIIILICIFAQIKGVYADDLSNGNYTLNYMSYGYTITAQVLILLECNKLNKDKLKLIINIISFIAIILSVIYGNRGILITYFFYYLYNFTLRKKILTTDNIKKKIILFFVLLLLLLNLKFILIMLNNFFDQLGIHSRNLTKLLSNSFMESTNRNIIYKQAIELIEKNPFLVHGPGYLKTQMHNNSNIHLNNANAHNIILELFVEYGIIFGAIILKKIGNCLYYGWYIEKKFLNEKRLKMNKIGVALLIHAITMLMFSSSLYECPELWIGIALVLVSKDKYKLLLEKREKK